MIEREFFVVQRLKVAVETPEVAQMCATHVASLHCTKRDGGGAGADVGDYSYEFGDHEVVPAPEAAAHRALNLVLEERHRQKAAGFTPDHDDDHTQGELAAAAAAYAHPVWPASNDQREGHPPAFWPFEASAWRHDPSDPIRNATKAAALMLAELERLIRLRDRAVADAEGVHT